MTKSITVLTFGWEFPPHISGGLGTACHGLTKALIEQGANILFVVPRAHGDEDISLISASDVPMSLSKAPSPSARSVRPDPPVARRGMTVVPVTSPVRPYTTAVREPALALEEWQYSVPPLSQGKAVPGTVRAGGAYHFSGTYGPNLLEEVARYGEVGAVLAAQHRFDVIHAHDWLAFPAGVAAKKASGKPLILHVHATEYDRAGSPHVDPRVYTVEKEGMADADHIVAVSEWTREILIERYGVPGDKISVVHNGLTIRMEQIHSRPSRPGKHVVTFVGRVTHQKGPQYFVEAARKVLEQFPDAHFILAGAGDLLPAMIERVAALRLSSHFHFTGFLRGRQVEQVWSVTDVYVMPSVSEPFGITPLEAIGSGVPVVLSKQSGVGEVMPHAIKADFWDIEALAGAICSVLQHKSLSKTLRRQGKKALKDITWDIAARKLNELYHDVVAREK